MSLKNKCSTIEDLEDILDNDLSWRKQEIINLKLMILKNDTSENILVRSGIALLCAHFEGFIKHASNAYVAYVSSQDYNYFQLKSNFLALSTSKKIINILNSNKMSTPIKLIDEYKELLFQKITNKKLRNGTIIETHSNPSSKELKEILKSIGINSDIFNLKSNYIDELLLKKRHCIVHGEKRFFQKKDFLELFEIILPLMDDYKYVIVDSAINEEYLKVGN